MQNYSDDSRSLKIVHSAAASEILIRFANLAKAIGVATESVRVSDFASLERTMEETTDETGLVLDVASLAPLCVQASVDHLGAIFRRRHGAMLLLASETGEAVARLLQIATDGAVGGVETTQDGSRVSFPETVSRLSQELSSHSFPRKDGIALALTIEDGHTVELLMKVGPLPSFVRLRNESVFIWSTPSVFDVERPLSAELEFEETADEYIPAILFLRFALAEYCWQNPDPGAGIVIDDPLLKARYGCIDFPSLLTSARTLQYHVTLAFIPWNYWRTGREAAQLFREYSDCFGICAHGCDHTDSEFRHGTYEELLSRDFIASNRMGTHAARTGMPSQPLMVCPKEQYSTEAMRAFADSRQFMALVCTACMPRNLARPELTGADLLLPAQDSFFGFPVFKRHYPNDTSDAVFAMALFLGKPAILVEHHEFFRDGPAKAEEFVRLINGLRPGLQWRSLEETITRTHARRRFSENGYEIRFFTDVFHLEADIRPAVYRFIRRVPDQTPVGSVRVADQEVLFSRENGLLRFEVKLTKPSPVTIEVQVAPIMPSRPNSKGLKYQASVALRRGLCEMRDYMVAKFGTQRMSKVRHTAEAELPQEEKVGPQTSDQL